MSLKMSKFTSNLFTLNYTNHRNVTNGFDIAAQNIVGDVHVCVRASASASERESVYEFAKPFRTF